MRVHCCSRGLTFSPFPETALAGSIPDCFALQVDSHRDCVAIRDRGRSITYGELDAWSNGIATALLDEFGAEPEPVPLVQLQGAASIAATLGVLKAGKFYVPLDPLEPAARLRHVIDRVGARLVVSDRESHAAAQDLGQQVLSVDGRSAAQCLADHVPASSVAYVYFTAGSTGRPKGVYDSHRNVLHNVLRYTNALEIGPSDRLTLLQRPSFSGAVSSLFCALLNGATTCPFRLAGGGVADVAGWLRKEEITIYHSVPAIFRTVAGGGGGFPDVRVVRLEGDRASALDMESFERHFTPGSVLANGLGATETGLARQLLVRHGDEIPEGILPVGYPVRDVDAAILDEQGAELPHGATGEIGVRSAYLALGYWNEPDLTEESFSSGSANDPRRLYRTGDVGRLRSDGCLEYLGRLDSQLKVLGNRVDLAEVESELIRLPGIKDAAVVTVEGRRGEGRLVAYLVADDESGHDPFGLREALSQTLPEYSVPMSFIRVDSLPSTANGKLDRAQLRVAATRPSEAGARGDEQVAQIASIWSEVLEVTVAADDDFFELGGDSLAAAEIQSRIADVTGVELPLAGFVLAPTPREHARRVLNRTDAALPGALVELRAGETKPPLVLTHGINGNTLHYARLVPEITRRVIGIELDDPEADLAVCALAKRYVDLLREAQPHGPYLLSGFCSGAVLAREMACRLEREGEQIPLLVILGISPLDLPDLLAPAALCRWESFQGRLRYHLGRAWTMQRSELFPYLGGRARTIARRTLRGPRGADRRLAPLPAKLAASVAAHSPGPYAGPVLLVLDKEATRRYTSDPVADWSALTTGPLSAHVLPGGDHSMLYEAPIAQVCGALLSAALDQALAPQVQTLP